MSKQRVLILGSTGSIGRSTLNVLRGLSDQFQVVGLAASNRWEDLAGQAAEFNVRHIAISSIEHSAALRSLLGKSITVLAGDGAMSRLIDESEPDIVVCAVVGAAGMRAVYRAAERGLRVALANKEALVTAGSLLMPLARRTGARILPIDSEHSAVFQALQAGTRDEVSRIILTASGGPFRTWTREQMEGATAEEALNHPTWNMGPKISIDSATMMNKALEIIEARWLFDFPVEKIEVLVHPESIVHSMVEFCDGSIVAQMGTPDMRTPIQYALTYPSRLACPSNRLDLCGMTKLHFCEPDEALFPALGLGREVARRGGTAGAVVNAANEAAVALFQSGEIRFTDIVELTAEALSAHEWMADPTLDDLTAADHWARDEVMKCRKC